MDAIREFRQRSREVVRELDLLKGPRASPLECHVLLELERAPGLAPGRLCELLHADKAVLSRALRRLQDAGWVSAKADASDGRRRSLALTAAGRREVARIHQSADRRVRSSLDALAPEDRDVVLRGMALYARGLRLSRVRADSEVRRVRRADDAALARLIRSVAAEFGVAGAGSSVTDPEVPSMSRAYAARGHAYFVVRRGGRLVGGGGIGPLAGGEPGTCELRKMYLLAETRGLGLGQVLLERCLEAAREMGYTACYLETSQRMEQARRLYERNGFRRLCSPRGATGHSACDTWYARELSR